MELFKKNIDYFAHGKSQINLDLIKESPDYELLYFNENESEFIRKDEEVYEIKYEVDNQNLPNKSIKEIYFILGISNLNELNSLISSANPKTIFYIIEPQPGFLKFIFNQFDFNLLNKVNINIFCDSMENLPNYLEKIFRTEETLLIRNVKVYGDYFYRNFDLNTFKHFIKTINRSVQHNMFKFGNSIEDSLIGLAHNTYNMRFLKDSLNFSEMKDLFKNKPAIIVSAGPSLEKNIHHLIEVQETAIILAVDTIAERLTKEGVTPHLIFAIERVYEVYEYFFKNKEYPINSTLVVPPVVQPKIIEEYKGNIVLPFRQDVHEYSWFNRIYNFTEDSFMNMGLSVAHLAFGFAKHLGCSPIILTGQDLALGESGTHISGTSYDKMQVSNKEKYIETEGYYGDSVKTSQIWLEFKNLFELEINKNKLHVIDATEGGALIQHTQRMSLEETMQKYCTVELNVKEVIDEVNKYHIDQKSVDRNYEKEIKVINEIFLEARNQGNMLKLININKSSSISSLKRALQKMKGTDTLLQRVMKHPLYMHNLQSYFILTFTKFNSLSDELSYDNVKKNLDIQLNLCETIASVGDLIVKTIDVNQVLTREDLYSGDAIQ